MYRVQLLENPVKKIVKIPGSKSITNRMFLLAALANGKSVLKDPLKSDDTKYMKQALEELGIKVEETDHSFIIYGRGGDFDAGDKTLFLGNAGTATRFLTAAMVLKKGKTVIDGVERMRQRPIKDLLDALIQLGVEINCPTDCPPVEIISDGEFNTTELDIDGTASSQYISAVLQISPYLPQGLIINIKNNLVSKPYIDITLDVMRKFGVEVVNENYQRFTVKPQKYQAGEYQVEGDASAASYWFGMAALTQSAVTVENLHPQSVQGDVHFVDVVEKMGCRVVRNKENITVIGPKKLKGLGEINMNAMPDVAMTLAVIAAHAEGDTRIIDVENMRIKETDRITALVTEMTKMGIDCAELQDGLIVRGTENKYGAIIETYDDHRMAMCFAILGLVVEDVEILDPGCCAKTYPEFFEELSQMVD